MPRLISLFLHSVCLTFIIFVTGGCINRMAALPYEGELDYWLTFPVAIGISIAGALIITIVLFALSLCFRIGGAISILTLRSASVVAFFVTVFVPAGVQLIDGRPVISAGVLMPLIAIYSGYLLVTALLVVASRKWPNELSRLFIATVTLSFGVVLITTIFTLWKSEDRIAVARRTDQPVERLYEFGREKNIVIIMSDMLQGSFLEQSLNVDKKEKSILDDFYIFSRAVATFPYTNYSLPSILSGKPYASDDHSFASNLMAAIDDSFIVDARKKEFSTISVQSYPWLPVSMQNIQAIAVPDDERAPLVSVRDYLSGGYAVELAYLSAIRLLKFDYRAKFGWSDELSTVKKSSKNLLIRWAANAKIGSDKRKLIFVHSFLSHAPIVYNRNGQRYADLGQYPWTHQNLLEEISYSIYLAGNLFDKMRKLDIYDNALIMIIGDHGHFMGYYDPKNFVGTDDFRGYIQGHNYRPATMYNPAILIKPPHSRKGVISSDEIGLVDIRDIVDAYLQTWDRSLPEVLSQIRQKKPTIPVATCTKEKNVYFTDACIKLIQLQGNVSAIPDILEKLKD